MNENQISPFSDSLRKSQNIKKYRLKNEKFCKQLIQEYDQHFKEKKNTDFEIITANNLKILTHKSILRSRSPFFNAFLKEKNESQLFFPEFEYQVVYDIIRYIYSSKLYYQPNKLHLYWFVASKFQLYLAAESIKQHFFDVDINPDNVLDFFFMNKIIQPKKMEQKTIEFIAENLGKIKNNKQIAELSQEEILGIIKYRKDNDSQKGNVLVEFINNWAISKTANFDNQDFRKKFFIKLTNNLLNQIPYQYFDIRQDVDLQKLEFQPKHLLLQTKLTQYEKSLQKLEKRNIENEEKTQIQITEIKKSFMENQIKEKEEHRRIKKQRDDRITELANSVAKLQKENKHYKKKAVKMKRELQHFKTNTNQLSETLKTEKSKKIVNEVQNTVFSRSQIILIKEHVKKLKEWINDDYFFSKIKLGFSAKMNGFNSKAFHQYCDNKEKSLVIIKTKDGYIFGGFTQTGFVSGKDEYLSDSAAFLFSLKNPKGDPPQKFPIKKENYFKAVFYSSSWGPVFGDCDLILYSDFKPGTFNFGKIYSLPSGIYENSDEAKNYFAGSNSWKVKDLEVYFN